MINCGDLIVSNRNLILLEFDVLKFSQKQTIDEAIMRAAGTKYLITLNNTTEYQTTSSSANITYHTGNLVPVHTTMLFLGKQYIRVASLYQGVTTVQYVFYQNMLCVMAMIDEVMFDLFRTISIIKDSEIYERKYF